jgi:hypothetical protein
LRTALVKQKYDVFGPWSAVKWKDTSPLKLFEVWPGKAVYWELTCLLQADWYIIPQNLNTDYKVDAIHGTPGRMELLDRYVNGVTAVEEIPFPEYDLVITFDPILELPKKSHTVFAYYAQEHWDPIFARSLRRPMGNYDLFLDHMLSARELRRLPQAIAFPYVYDSQLARSLFAKEKRDIAWVDWRTFMTLAGKRTGEPWCAEAEEAKQRLQATVEMELRCRTAMVVNTYCVSDPPAWGDAEQYLRELGECRFYVGVGQMGGAGQALADAVSLGCICLGQADRAYHRVLCHPSCLCGDTGEIAQWLRKISNDPERQKEILEWQDEKFRRNFMELPLRSLRRALAIKNRQSSSKGWWGGWPYWRKNYQKGA